MLAVIETHPIQYHAPVYRTVEQRFGVPVTAVYGSDFSLEGCIDPEFAAPVGWGTGLLEGHSQRFLRRVREGGARSSDEVAAHGLDRALAELRPSAILLVGYRPRFHQLAFWAARRTGRPLLFRAETTDHARERSAVTSWLRDRMLRRFYGEFARLLYIGTRSREHYARLGCAPGKLVFSPYCVDPAPFRPSEDDRERLRSAARDELGLSQDRIVLLFSGKLSERKGVDVLLAAVKRMRPELRSRVALVFAGSGERAEALSREAAAAPPVTIRMAGFREQAALSPLYHAADLLVLPSLYSETWGLVVNDALHHGLPCVVSRAVGCASDLVVAGSTGETCETGNAPSLALTIERALALTGRREVRDACRARVEGFSVERAARGIAEAYAAAVGPMAAAS